jgi:hypothetical protein
MVQRLVEGSRFRSMVHLLPSFFFNPPEDAVSLDGKQSPRGCRFSLLGREAFELPLGGIYGTHIH